MWAGLRDSLPAKGVRQNGQRVTLRLKSGGSVTSTLLSRVAHSGEDSHHTWGQAQPCGQVLVTRVEPLTKSPGGLAGLCGREPSGK